MAVKVGVVGLSFGRIHVESLAQMPEAKIVALADLNEAKVKEFTGKFGGNGYCDWKEMIKRQKDLDAVVLATPAHIRLDPIRAICRRGLAMFTEKPPALDMRSASKITAVIEKAKIINSVGFMYRWAPNALRMRELISGRQRLFARLVIAWPVFSWVRDGLAPQRLYQYAGCGGPMIEQGIHYQDVLRYIVQDEPVALQAMVDPGRIFPTQGRDCEETFALTMRHASGMLTSHVHNWSHGGMVMDLQVVGRDFDLTWHMTGGTNNKLEGKVGEQVILEGSEERLHLLEIQGFVKAVATNDQSIIRSSYADAARTLAVCAAATRSIRTGKTVKLA